MAGTWAILLLIALGPVQSSSIGGITVDRIAFAGALAAPGALPSVIAAHGSSAENARSGVPSLEGSQEGTSGSGWVNISGNSQAWPNATTSIGASMAYDADDGYVLLFGGGPDRPGVGNETWEFEDGHWTRVFPALVPPARYEAAMAYDAADGYVLMYGGLPYCQFVTGEGQCPPPLNDTWAFKSGQWTQLHPARTPLANVSVGMTYDAADGYILLFGGQAGAVGPREGGGAQNSTWAFRGGQWTELFPKVQPSARYAPCMTYDARDGNVLLFGGAPGETTQGGDTWTYLNGSWTQVSPAQSPQSRSYASCTYDPDGGFVLLYGGSTIDEVQNGDTWEYSSGAWSEVSTSPSPPPDTWGSMAFDAADGYAVLLVGNHNASNTWAFFPIAASSPALLGVEEYALVGGASAVGVVAAAVALVTQRRAMAHDIGRTGGTSSGSKAQRLLGGCGRAIVGGGQTERAAARRLGAVPFRRSAAVSRRARQPTP